MNSYRGQKTYILFVLPSVIVFSLVIIIPFIQGFYYSFTNWGEVIGTVDFVGFANYKELFSDVSFYYSLIITFVYAILSILVVNIVALCLASLTTSKIRGTSVFRAGFFLPNLIGGLILGYIWQFIFNGFINEILGGSPLSDPNSALFSLVFVLTWQYAGYIMMIYITAILNIPQEIIEASEIDGAGKISQWLRVKLPMLASAFTITLFLTMVNAFKQFDVIYSLTGGGPSRELFDGSVVQGTSTLAVDIYDRAYQLRVMAEAQSEAVVFFVILGTISIIQVYVNKKREVEA